MKKDSFIALNICYNNELIHKKNPIIFYWNGISDIISDIKNSEAFYNIVSDYLTVPEKYENTSLYITTVNFDQDQSLNEKIIPLQELYPINELDNTIKESYLIPLIYNIYEKVFEKDYEIPIDEMTFENKVYDIYEDIQNKLDKPISKQTFINYILSKLDEKTNLIYYNKKILIDYIKDILKES